MFRKDKIISLSATAIVNDYLNKSIELKASDIHFQPGKSELLVRFRVDGVLQEVGRESLEAAESIIARIKVLAGLDTSESRLPQDGRFQQTKGDRKLDFRVSTFNTYYGECVVIRILDLLNVTTDLRELGLNNKQVKILEPIIKRPHGLILVTGPTGSGKTTTLFCFLNLLNSSEKCLVTLEDPIEYHLPLLRQTQIDIDHGLTFVKGLRALFRQNPDIIMLGEIRDQETAKVTIQAAISGHLVLTTIHTNDSVGAIVRLLNMEIEPFLIASALSGVVAQRLVRKICSYCQEPYKPSAELLEQLGWSKRQINFDFKKGKGCSACNYTGYRGRAGIFEILPLVDREVKDLIISKAALEKIFEWAKSQGITTLRQAGLEKVIQGITTVEEVLRLTAE